MERVVVLPYHMVRQFSTTGCFLVFWGLEVSTSNSDMADFVVVKEEEVFNVENI